MRLWGVCKLLIANSLCISVSGNWVTIETNSAYQCIDLCSFYTQQFRVGMMKELFLSNDCHIIGLHLKTFFFFFFKYSLSKLRTSQPFVSTGLEVYILSLGKHCLYNTHKVQYLLNVLLSVWPGLCWTVQIVTK